MSQQSLLLLLGFAAATMVVFYILGWILRKRWKYLVYPIVLLGFVGVILIIAGFNYKPDCSQQLEESWCGLEVIGFFVYGIGLLIGSVVCAALGLPFARMGSKRQVK